MVRYGRRDPGGKTPTRLLPPCSNTAQTVAGVQSTEPSETAAVYLLVSRAVNIEVVGCTDWFATRKEELMAVRQGDLSLLEHPVARELLASNIPARIAYVWTDGTPRVTPIWFHWDGGELVLGT